MNGWVYVVIGAAAVFAALVMWPQFKAGRDNDEANGRLEEQQP